MKRAPRSRLESWLGPEAEFLMGDLLEERTRRAARGKLGASIWFWAQVVGALARSGVRGRSAGDASARGSFGPGPGDAGEAGLRGLSLDLAVFSRKLRRRPVWAGAIVCVLALGIGANAAMFAGFDAWVTRPLPFSEPAALVSLTECQLRQGVRNQPVSPRNLADWRERQSSLARIEAFQRVHFNLADAGDPARVRGARVSHALFDTLGVLPILGRPFQPRDDQPGQPTSVALISHRLWHQRYGADAAVLGTTIHLDGRPYEITGVMPVGFRFPEWQDVWTPLGLEPRASRRDERWLSVIARLEPGSSIERARADMDRIAGEIQRASPETSLGWSVEVRPVRDLWVPPVIDVALTVSLVAGLFVLLIVCANIASLMLAEATSRARETAIRAALGASGWRLARPVLVESLLLALAAGAAGVAVCVAWVDWMTGRAPTEPPYLFAMRLDGRVVLYALAISAVAGTATALAPIARRSGRRLLDDLSTGGRATSIAGARLRSVLVAGELALSTALVIGALLLVKSFHHQQSADLGYRTQALYTMRLSLTGHGFEDPIARAGFLRRLEDELRASSGIRDVGVSVGLPTGGGSEIRLETPSHPAERQEGERALLYALSGQYLEALDVGLRGRAFTEPEMREGADVAIVSASLAQALWGGGEALGQSLRPVTDAGHEPWLRVVGVAGDVRWPEDMVAPGSIPVHQIYRPYASMPHPAVDLVVESDFPPDSVAASVREAVRRSGSPVPVSEILTMQETIRRSQWVTRFFSEQLVAYAAFALLIAAVGIYGLVADSVAQRSRELAVRLALGARPGDVRRAVVGGILKLGAVGLAAGLLLGVAIARLSGSMLGGVSATDPTVLTGVAGLLVATLLAASYGPARRASNADPARVLRAE